MILKGKIVAGRQIYSMEFSEQVRIADAIFEELLEAKKFKKLGDDNMLGLTLGQPRSDQEYYDSIKKPYPIKGSKFWRAWCVSCGEPMRVPRSKIHGALCEKCKEPGKKRFKIKATGKKGEWRSAGLASGHGAIDVAQAGGKEFGKVSPGTKKR